VRITDWLNTALRYKKNITVSLKYAYKKVATGVKSVYGKQNVRQVTKRPVSGMSSDNEKPGYP
jgi:hypothetical protein